MNAYEELDTLFHRLAEDVQPDPGQRANETERQYWNRLINEGVAYIRRMNVAYARAERDYRKARAIEWAHVKAEGGRTAKHAEDEVDARTADKRYIRDLAQGEKQGALDSLRSRSAQLSAWQTDRKVGVDEVNHALYAPEPDQMPPMPPHPAEVGS